MSQNLKNNIPIRQTCFYNNKFWKDNKTRSGSFLVQSQK